MRKVVLVVGLVAAMVASAVGIATAADGDKVTASSKVSKGGTPQKPKNLTVSYKAAIEGPDAATRAETATALVATWTGMKVNTKGFPKCDRSVVDTAQSDASCPKKSLLASGRIEAVLGADPIPTEKRPCKRDVKLYYGGGSNVFVYNYGNPADCLGLAYVPTAPGTFKKKGNKVIWDLPIPDFVQHPVPGLSGYFSLIEVKFDNKNTVKSGGKQVTFLQGIGCGKQKKRQFTFTAETASNPKGITSKSVAGKC